MISDRTKYKTRTIASAICVLAWVFILCACSGSDDRPANVLLVTLDTVRSERFGCYGYERNTTPVIDRLAAKGVLFEQAFTPVPITLPSHTTILTGTHPVFHGIHNNGTFVLEDAARSLAEDLKDAGFRTGAVVAAVVLDSQFGLDQGFDFFEDRIDTGSTSSVLISERKADEVTRLGLQWLEQAADDPFFLWLHYFDPHEPYAPPPTFAQKFLGSPYDGEIAFMDFCFGKVLAGLEQLGVADNTLIVVVGDHGEGLGDHDEDSHGIFIYDTTVRVPMIFHWPQQLEEGSRIEPLVSTLDIRPTVLDMLGMPDGKVVQGRSFLPLLQNKKIDSQPILLETNYPALNFGWSPLAGIRTEEWKYIDAPQPELYHVEVDAGEMQDLSLTDPDRMKAMETLYHRYRKKLEPRAGAALAGERSLDAEMEERLKSLGYVWADGAGETADSEAGQRDPKEMVKLTREFNLGTSLVDSGRVEDGLHVLKNLVEKDPHNAKALSILGFQYFQKGNTDRARDYLLRAVRASPDFTEAHVSLGLVCMKEKDYAGAIRSFEAAVQIVPKAPIPLYNLGMAYTRHGDHEQAEKSYCQVLDLDPSFVQARINLADLYLVTDRIPDAERELLEVVEQNPSMIRARLDLAELYHQTGRIKKAIKLVNEVLKSRPDHARADRLLIEWGIK